MASGKNVDNYKGRRISIDLAAEAAFEVDRLRERLGVSTADLFRNALHLIQLYVRERDRGNALYVANAEVPDMNRSRIELPVLTPVRSVRDPKYGPTPSL